MYKKLIDNIFSDFKDFFVDIKFSKFIKYRFVDDMSGGMKVSRTGSKAYIAISNDIKFLDINNDVSKIYVLFMIGHELAHLVNKHLEYNDKNKFDSQTLEMWADYFGTKISMSILQNGTRFQKMLNLNVKDANIGLETISQALIILNKNIYINTNYSNKYLHSNQRVSTVIAGIISFLTRKEMIMNFQVSKDRQAYIGFGWGMAIIRKLLKQKISNELSRNKNFIDIPELSKNVFIIHNSLKQKNRQLIKGLDFFHSFILDTSYGEHIPNQMMKDKFNQEFNKLGWDMKL